MKRIVYSTIIIFALLSCAKEESVPVTVPDQGGNVATAVSVNCYGFENEDGTKAEINSKLDFSWSTGDQIGVWPLRYTSGQDSLIQVSFTAQSSASQTTFKSTNWGMICNGIQQYASYFPYNSSYPSEETVSVTYPTYVQILSKESLAHVNENLCMYAPAIRPERAVEASFHFYQLGALAKFVITPTGVSTTTKFRKITISAPEPVFYTSASYKLSELHVDRDTTKVKKPTITGTPTERYIGANLKDLTASGSEPLTLYYPMCPAALEGVTLTVKLYDDRDSLYTGTYKCGKNQESGMCYNYRVNVSLTPKQHPDPATIEGVDLGFGLLFAPFNLGATSPEENGWLFAYGETVTKPEYTSSNYTRYITGSDSLAIEYKKIYYGRSVNVFNDEYDAAAQIWGNGWFVPDYNNVNDQLQYNCDKEWVTCNGIEGYRFYNPTDHSKSIFIPSASQTINLNTYSKNTLTSCYWGAHYLNLKNKTTSSSAYFIWIQKQYPNSMGQAVAYPHEGKYIRPVKKVN